MSLAYVASNTMFLYSDFASDKRKLFMPLPKGGGAF